MDKEFVFVITAVVLAAFTIWRISSYIPLNKSEWVCGNPVVSSEDPSDTDCTTYVRKGAK